MKRLIDQKLIDWAKSLEEYVRYDISSNTLEVGTNLYVDGEVHASELHLTHGSYNRYIRAGYQYLELRSNKDDKSSTRIPISSTDSSDLDTLIILWQKFYYHKIVFKILQNEIEYTIVYGVYLGDSNSILSSNYKFQNSLKGKGSNVHPMAIAIGNNVVHIGYVGPYGGKITFVSESSDLKIELDLATAISKTDDISNLDVQS